MEKTIKMMLQDEVATAIESLENLSPDSEEYKATTENICKLHKLIMDEGRLELDGESNFYDERRKDNSQKDDKKFQYIKFGLEAAGIVLPLMFYAVWMNKGFKFEESGAYTSTTFKGLFNRFRPTK